MRIKLYAALVMFGFAATNAVATPINYSFTSGPVRSATGVSAGLLPPSTTVTGSFTYDASAPFVATAASGAGSIYGGAITNFVLNIGDQTVSDPFGYAYVANDLFYVPGPVAPGARLWDLMEFHLGPPGLGGWSGLSIDEQNVERIRFYFEEGPLGLYGDFLNDEQLLPLLPTFTGGLSLDFGPIGGGSSYLGSAGVMMFGDLRVTTSSVPEPATTGLFALGLIAMGFVRRRRQANR